MTYNSILAACQYVSRLRLLQFICLSLSILIVWQFAAGLFFVYGLSKQLVDDKKTVVVNSPRSQSSIKVGLNAPFFGQYTPVISHVGDVKTSRLTYKVVGIMLASREEDSEVMIDTLSGGHLVYHVGDVLPWGTVIKRITSEGIFVERNGELESLSLPKNELIFEPPAKPL